MRNGIGRSRSDDHEVGLTCERIKDGFAPGRSPYDHMVAGQHLKRQIGYEARGGIGHEHAHVASELHEARRQVGGLVGRDAARDADDYGLS